ncbi:MAG TPA: hypothetical protein PLV64_21810, partial [Anaerolineales bacterium]|nr:hypothetical protein [Anaerolineales bacterium]
MSCEQSRHKYFERKSASGVLSAEELERVYQQNRHMPGSRPRTRPSYTSGPAGATRTRSNASANTSAARKT